MNRYRLYTILLAALTAAVLAACAAASKPIGEWQNESYTGQADHILIIGATRRNERRRSFESQFAAALAARGIPATPSYKLVPDSKDLTRETVDAAIRGKDIDAVLVTRLAGIKRADVFRLPANYDHDRDFITYYDHALRQSSPAFDDEYHVLTLETNLYEVATGQLVWKMQSEAIGAERQGEVITAQIELTIKALEKRKLIAPAR